MFEIKTDPEGKYILHYTNTAVLRTQLSKDFIVEEWFSNLCIALNNAGLNNLTKELVDEALKIYEEVKSLRENRSSSASYDLALTHLGKDDYYQFIKCLASAVFNTVREDDDFSKKQTDALLAKSSNKPYKLPQSAKVIARDEFYSKVEDAISALCTKHLNV